MQPYQASMLKGEKQLERLDTLVKQFSKELARLSNIPAEKTRWIKNGLTVAGPKDSINFDVMKQSGNFAFAISLHDHFLHQVQVQVDFQLSNDGLSFKYGKIEGYENHAFATICNAIVNEIVNFFGTNTVDGTKMFTARFPAKTIVFF
jgi:hypothetical protein